MYKLKIFRKKENMQEILQSTQNSIVFFKNSLINVMKPVGFGLSDYFGSTTSKFYFIFPIICDKEPQTK